MKFYTSRFSLLIILIILSISIGYASDEFFERMDYKGAFGATNWAAGWTALYHYGIMAEPVQG
ncbi:MAG: hypothetical protein GXO77_13680, partial [Calditrichaeota bacterium]|nr:hypothetical protein [Calditrichota bacterium]